ncbi:hypothetical protein, partial [Chromohalobacter sp. HP20-39]|uniref:hypothetical protein n=1 Tax=Chromohalobacter sp. HP20-39 TaxID=3079306 RepID=UPI00294ABDB0
MKRGVVRAFRGAAHSTELGVTVKREASPEGSKFLKQVSYLRYPFTAGHEARRRQRMRTLR